MQALALAGRAVAALRWQEAGQLDNAEDDLQFIARRVHADVSHHVRRRHGYLVDAQRQHRADRVVRQRPGPVAVIHGRVGHAINRDLDRRAQVGVHHRTC